MNFFDIPEKELEELYNTEIDELEFSVRTYNCLRRGRCDTVAKLAYVSIEEVQEMKNMSQHGLKEVQEKLAARNISLMTQEEKQQLLTQTENPDVLRRRMMILEHREKESQETIRRLERESNNKWKKIKEKQNRALMEARGIVRTSSHPIARLLESMYFGDSANEGCRFCDIFELWNEHCFAKEDGDEVEHSCEECIETFLADYYRGQYMSGLVEDEEDE
ncbi:MAG: DNA-directed RNA polymerase subunit alpha C-terminal domain-containing protein [Roseburia sp.]